MRALMVLAATACMAGAGAPAAMAHGGGTKTWKVTIENLTPTGPGAPGSQPLSPPLLVVHSRAVDVWSVGARASTGVATIAEDADTGPATAALAGAPGVRSVQTGAGGAIPSGAARAYTVTTRARYNRLSVGSMLVNTNDGFTGLDALRLRGGRRVVSTAAYDAGSERNNELAAFIPGPCCGHAFVRDPEHAAIAHHRGIVGVGDLDPGLYGWTDPVARITVTRVR